MTLKNLLLAHKKMCGEPIVFYRKQPLFMGKCKTVYK